MEAGIVVSPGTYFGLDGAGEGFVRIAMVPELANCARAIEVWRGVHQQAPWKA